MPYETTCPKGHRLQVSDAPPGAADPVPGVQRVVRRSRRQPAPVAGPAGQTGALERLLRPGLGSRPLLAPGRAADGGHRSGPRAAFQGLRLDQPARRRACGGDCAKGRRAIRRRRQDQGTCHPAQIDEKSPLGGEAKPNATRTDFEELNEGRRPTWPLPRPRIARPDQPGEWRELKIAARTASSDHKINGYWRKLFFVFASIVLSLGLWWSQVPAPKGPNAGSP